MTNLGPLRVADVFVAGGLPRYTYNPRNALGLEEQVQDYLDTTRNILSVTGPTKTGKTVLIKKMLEDRQPIWVSGALIQSSQDLWENVADELDLNTAVDSETSVGGHDEGTFGGELSAGIAKFSATAGGGGSHSATQRTGRVRKVEVAARKELRASVRPLVIDDFHYIEPEVQLQIVRSLKDLIFDGLPVIVLAVPHRAFDIVRSEKEMTGRVKQLPIQLWSNDELRRIASTGFQTLNLVDEASVITERLVEQSFASPHLMQEFCLDVVKASGIRVRPEDATMLQQPLWDPFFIERSATTSKTAFDRLAIGRRQRDDRKRRLLKDGRSTDIYGAILLAIGHTGPTAEITLDALRSAMKELLAEDPPRKQEIVRVLVEMSKIAKEVGGEPVVDYDAQLWTLHISDPYFAFFLRWNADRALRQN